MEKLILYSYFRSSASYRVRIALHWKKIPFEYRAVHLVKEGGMQLKPEFQNLNPMRQVPLLVDGNFKISQSIAIMIYLDEKFPQNRLIPQDAKNKSLVFELSEIINSGIQPLQNVSVANEIGSQFNQSKERQADWIKYWIERGMHGFESKLNEVAGEYCVGDEVTMVDACLVPQITSSIRFGVDVSKFPRALKIYNNCQELEAFQLSAPGKQPDAE